MSYIHEPDTQTLQKVALTPTLGILHAQDAYRNACIQTSVGLLPLGGSSMNI